MRLYKTKWFARASRKNGISDSDLRDAIERARKGLVDADLGGHLIKQRVARVGQGKRGGFRVIIAFDEKTRAVFLLAFAKNALDNVTAKELESLRTIAALWLEADDKKLERAIREGELLEMTDDKAKN